MTVGTGVPVRNRHWVFVAAAFDGPAKEMRLYQEPLPVSPGVDACAHAVTHTAVTSISSPTLNDGPCLIGAFRAVDKDDQNGIGAHFNGKIDSPRIANRALNRAEMEGLLNDPAHEAISNAVVAAWDFSKDISSERISDLSVNGLHGETIQLPTRAVTGYNWSGKTFDWKQAPEEYGAIHFHNDDLYDAQWETDFTYTISEDMRSGVYAARLRTESSEDYIPFFVRPPKGVVTADVALAS